MEEHLNPISHSERWGPVVLGQVFSYRDSVKTD
jgi:hypothetical protein